MVIDPAFARSCRTPYFCLMQAPQRPGITSTLVILRQVVTIALVLLYGLGSLRIESLHQLIHQEETALHSSEQELNACHRTVFHFNPSEHCGHETHFSSLWKCPFCDVHFTAHDIPEALTASSAPLSGADHSLGTEFHLSSGAFPYAPARAPPVG
jgi:hypothetical protein